MEGRTHPPTRALDESRICDAEPVSNPLPKLPSQYEDLNDEFRARLRPDRDLLQLVQSARRSMQVSGGIRFLPLYGLSGSGKSSAVRELASHLEGIKVVELSRDAVASRDELMATIDQTWGNRDHPDLIVAVVDQYEETVSETAAVPREFVERISLADRNELRGYPVLFVWLTTDAGFQRELAEATSRNRRILVEADYELVGPERSQWAEIVEETFEAHNDGLELADEGVLRADIDEIGDASQTIGETMLKVGRLLGATIPGLHDLSEYQVIMLWPVTDGQAISRIQQFTHPRDGYRLNWNSFWRDLNDQDRRTLPLKDLNRARLHFDVRLVPIAAADLLMLGRDLGPVSPTIGDSYLKRFAVTHFYAVLQDTLNSETYRTMVERPSARSDAAKVWYPTVTTQSVALGRRIARALQLLGLDARHEKDLSSHHSTVRADVYVERPEHRQSKVIVELKAYSPDNTIPSTIRDQIRVTLRRHAQFAGFLGRS